MSDIRISLEAARRNAKLTQRQVASALRVSTATVVSWEKGTTEPKMSQAEMLSELYAMPLNNIFLPMKWSGERKEGM